MCGVVCVCKTHILGQMHVNSVLLFLSRHILLKVFTGKW